MFSKIHKLIQTISEWLPDMSLRNTGEVLLLTLAELCGGKTGRSFILRVPLNEKEPHYI